MAENRSNKRKKEKIMANLPQKERATFSLIMMRIVVSILLVAMLIGLAIYILES